MKRFSAVPPKHLPPAGFAVQLALAVILALELPAAEPTNGVDAKVLRPTPFPSLLDSAKAAGIPLASIGSGTGTSNLESGDSVTALVVQHRKSNSGSQRLIHLEVVDPKPGELPAKKPGPITVYSSLGDKLEFTSSPIMSAVRIIGPFLDADSGKKPPTVQDKTVRLSLDEAHLRLGVDQLADFLLRSEQMETNGQSRWEFDFDDKPFGAAEIAKCRKKDEALQITVGEERALAGGPLALISYLETVARTPGLKDILFHVVELPSAWSMVKHLGIEWDGDFDKGVAAGDGVPWGLAPASKVYYLPAEVTANGHPALGLTFIVTAPNPPLLACGGILGFLAQNPSDVNNYVAVRIIDARRGGQAAK